MRGIYLGDARPVPSQHGHMSLTGSYSGFRQFRQRLAPDFSIASFWRSCDLAYRSCAAGRLALTAGDRRRRGWLGDVQWRITQCGTSSASRKRSAPFPASTARVVSIPAWVQVPAATVTERGASRTGQPLRGSRMCE